MVNENGIVEGAVDADVDKDEEEARQGFAFDFNKSFEHMDWWPDLADLDRLNILNSPKEDRARLLASKYSKPLSYLSIFLSNNTLSTSVLCKRSKPR